jgi:hypothetical protein
VTTAEGLLRLTFTYPPAIAEILRSATLVVRIDRREVDGADWHSEVRRSLAAGSHLLHVHFGYQVFASLGAIDHKFRVTAGEELRLEYRAPVVIGRVGSIRELSG